MVLSREIPSLGWALGVRRHEEAALSLSVLTFEFTTLHVPFDILTGSSADSPPRQVRVSTGIVKPGLSKQSTDASLSSDDVPCESGQEKLTGLTAERRLLDGGFDSEIGRGSGSPQRPRLAHTRGSSEAHLITDDHSPNNSI